MAENSKIEWTKHTQNLWWGCTKVHTGCDNCYAETLSKRWGFDVWGQDAYRREIKSAFSDLERFQKKAQQANEQHRVFIGSMMDIFEKSMQVVNAAGILVPGDENSTGALRAKLFTEISENKYPNLLFLLLTKRPSNINQMTARRWLNKPPNNIMFGTSISNQATANRLVPQLLKVNGHKFLSIEPMLGPVQLHPDWLRKNHLNFLAPAVDWVICGGESGPHKRPFNPDWARQLRDDCLAAGVPFFMKQMDKVQSIPDDLLIRQFPKLNQHSWQQSEF